MKYLIAVFALLYSGMVSADIFTIVMHPNPDEAGCEESRVNEGQVCSIVAGVVKEPDGTFDALCIMSANGNRMYFFLRPGQEKQQGALTVWPADVHIIEGEVRGAQF